MYTGIVESTGRIAETTLDGEDHRLRIETDLAPEIDFGESVAISGVCLTAEDADEDGFSATLSGETVERTYLSDLDPGDVVNVEPSLTVGDSLSGHVVKGTVDAVASVTEIEERDDEWRFSFAIPGKLDRYVVEKGAVALDGVSLTVASRDAETLTVAVVPTTYDLTTLSEKVVGDPVHVEADVIAKYVQRGVEACPP